MTFIKILNVVAMTLLIALAAVVPAMYLGRFVPAIFDTSLQQTALAAWLTGLVSWWAGRTVTRKQLETAHESSGGSNTMAVGITLGVLAAALALGVVLHFFGDSLLH